MFRALSNLQISVVLLEVLVAVGFTIGNPTTSLSNDAPVGILRDVTASNLAEACSYQENSTYEMMCQNYIRGFIDGMTAFQKLGKEGFCPPPGFDLYQAKKLIEKRFSDSPEALNWPAGLFLSVVLLQQFPCNHLK